MKKTIIAICILIIICSTACGQKELGAPKDSKTNKIELELEKETVPEKPVVPEKSEMPKTSETSVYQQFKIYSVNENVDGFLTEEVVAEAITAEIIVKNLIEKKVMPIGVEILSYNESQVDGYKAIDLDLSDTFATYLKNQGTSSEYYIMGSICNTFLDAFQCDMIKIKVNKEVLETGHAEYPSYMSRFQ